VSVEDADADTEAEHALFGEPGLPPPARTGWQRSRVLAPVSRRGRGRARGGDGCWSLQDFFDGLRRCSAVAPVVPDQDWVRLTQSQFEPVEDHPRVLDRADLAPSSGAGPPGHPARPGPGFWHRHPPDHAHVPALDCRPARRPGQRVLDYGCGSGILAIGATLHGAAQDIDAVDIDEAAVQSTQAERRGQ
jgi:ribosomal protein L11 methyltransferase